MMRSCVDANWPCLVSVFWFGEVRLMQRVLERTAWGHVAVGVVLALVHTAVDSTAFGDAMYAAAAAVVAIATLASARWNRLDRRIITGLLVIVVSIVGGQVLGAE